MTLVSWLISVILFISPPIVFAETKTEEGERFYAWIAKSQVMHRDALILNAELSTSNFASAERIANATPMLKFYADELNKQGVPLDFVILPLIESGNNPQAISPVNALGLWQFMPMTGKEWGLKRSEGVDDRVDVQKSTSAAAKFIRSLHQEFGDWNLVLAAYNWGPAAVRKALNKGLKAPGGKINMNYLPPETRNYLIRFYAFNQVIREGWNNAPLVKYPNQSYLLSIHPNNLDSYLTSTPNLGKVSESVLMQLNGLDSITIKKSSRPMLVPTQLFTQYFMPDKVVFGGKRTRVATIGSCGSQSAGYKIQRGDTLETISRKFKMSVNRLIDLNPEVRFARPGIMLNVC